jgi:hypothetical protein
MADHGTIVRSIARLGGEVDLAVNDPRVDCFDVREAEVSRQLELKWLKRDDHGEVVRLRLTRRGREVYLLPLLPRIPFFAHFLEPARDVPFVDRETRL